MNTQVLIGAPRLAPLYTRALLTAWRSGGPLPSTRLARDGVTVDRTHLAGYTRLCGFDLSDRLPLTYPHVLGFGMQLELMTSKGFPYPLLGLVHLANTFTRIRPLDAGEQLTLTVGAGEPGEHPRGRTFVLTTSATVDGQEVWIGRSTYLYRTSSSSGQRRRSEPSDVAGAPMVRWRLAGDAGRRYAEVSGDRNPIHLHPLTARPFGFRRPIAHGMFTAARCLAALGPHVPDAARADIEFAAPVPLPSTVDFHCEPDGDGWCFALHGNGGRRHLTGTARPRE